MVVRADCVHLGARERTYARMAWDRRDGLSIRERAILETLLGTNYPAPRTLEARFEARRALWHAALAIQTELPSTAAAP